MTRETEIAVMMADRYTKKEAINSLDLGTLIYEDPEGYINDLKNTDCYEGETVEDARSGKLTDIDMVTYEGKEYLIVIVH